MSKYRKILSQLASTGGDGTGTSNAIGDLSGANAVDLTVTPNAWRLYEIHRMIVTIEDDNNTIVPSKYGGVTALSNGINVTVENATGTLYSLTAFPITTNGEWASHCHDLIRHDWGSGNDINTIRWTFSKSGAPVYLDGRKGEFLKIALDDVFTGIITHRFVVQGYEWEADHAGA